MARRTGEPGLVRPDQAEKRPGQAAVRICGCRFAERLSQHAARACARRSPPGIALCPVCRGDRAAAGRGDLLRREVRRERPDRCAPSRNHAQQRGGPTDPLLRAGRGPGGRRGASRRSGRGECRRRCPRRRAHALLQKARSGGSGRGSSGRRGGSRPAYAGRAARRELQCGTFRRNRRLPRRRFAARIPRLFRRGAARSDGFRAGPISMSPTMRNIRSSSGPAGPKFRSSAPNFAFRPRGRRASRPSWRAASGCSMPAAASGWRC